jgi:hypothetical protein
MKNKTKAETDSLLRIPKAKNKLGLKIHKIAMPHDDLIRAEKPRFELIENESKPSHTTLSSQPSQPAQTRLSKEVAPSKDFQKTPNSITRRAIPDGLFKGKSKQLYDALYSLTRGAIIPIRHTRIRKSKLMKLANIGSRVTFDSNINHLQFVGLISETVFAGEHEGNQFEIFLPEEISTLPSMSSQSSHTSYAQKQDRLLSLETSLTSQSSKSIDTGFSDTPKTSLKTNIKTDDESARINDAFLLMAKRLDEAAKKLTGKGVSKNEAEKWGTLAELLILELETAAKRADSISSVPAFLTEVLRRKLMNADTAGSKSQKTKTDVIGKPNESGSYEIKLLDEQGRRAALAQLREFAGDEFLRDFEKWYTPADWEWLMTELEKSDAIKIDKTEESELG